MVRQAVFKTEFVQELEALFPKCGDERGEHLPRLHKAILEIPERSLQNELLLGGIDIDELSSDGVTALALAAQRQDPISISLLLKAGADPNESARPGRSPLIYAAQMLDHVSI